MSADPLRGRGVASAPSSTAADAGLIAAISVVRNAHPELFWGGWWSYRFPHPCGLEQGRAAMTSLWGVGQFRRALVLIEGATRTKGVNRNVPTYGWKHKAERLHRANNGKDDGSDCYVGEGSFIAAAYATGLLVKRVDEVWTFVNLSGKSIDYASLLRICAALDGGGR
jgi:hypothetical protein